MGENTVFCGLDELVALEAKGRCVVLIDGGVYDVTPFLSNHPGGQTALKRKSGADASKAFRAVGHSSYARGLLKEMRVGTLRDEAAGEAGLQSVSLHLPLAEEGEGGIDAKAAGCAAGQAAAWHSARRRAILLRHPEVARLVGRNPWTLLLGLFVVAVHAAVCVGCQLVAWYWVVLISYTIGAVCKMYQFMVGHELVHGLVSKTASRPWPRFLLLMLTQLPSFGSYLHFYISATHLGHHAILGGKKDNDKEAGETTADEKADVSIGLHVAEFDGDAMSPNTAMQALRNAVGLVVAGRAPKALAQSVGILFFNLSTLVWEAVLIGSGLVAGLAALACPCAVWWAAKSPQAGFQASRDLVFLVVASRALLQTVMWLLVLALLVYLPSLHLHSIAQMLGTAADSQPPLLLRPSHSALYLFLSEAFFNGFLLHPFAAYFMSVHRSATPSSPFAKQGDKAVGGASRRVTRDSAEKGQPQLSEPPGPPELCQPTMSTYSCLTSWSCGNLNFHVEHHDFPNMPFHNLPKLKKMAPEFYGHLASSKGFVNTIWTAVTSNQAYTYACHS